MDFITVRPFVNRGFRGGNFSWVRDSGEREFSIVGEIRVVSQAVDTSMDR